MKVKIAAGAELDLLSPKEFVDGLTAARAAWREELARGAKFRAVGGTGNKSGATWSISDAGHTHDAMGPRTGFVWSVTNIAVSGNGVVEGTDQWKVYVNSASPMTLIATGLTRYIQFNPGALVIPSDSSIAMTGAATGAGTDVFVSMRVIELPVQLAWQLI